jgi:hypothetical protein
MAALGRAGPDGIRRGALASTSGAPQVAQNFVAVPTGEPQRAQLGPDPGAVSRRPQCGQNGWVALARPPQNGQGTGSAGSRATAGRATTRVPGTGAAPPPDAAALSLVDLPIGLPQSMQNWAPGSLSRPQ